MISMKRKPRKSSGVSELAIAEPGNDYPYGLEISLDSDSLTKLGMDSLPEVGAVMTLTAKVKVTRVSEHASEGHSDKSVVLQITDMELATGKKAEAAGILYGA